MIQILMVLVICAVLLAVQMAGRSQSVVFEELITAIDFAGRLQGDNLEQGSNPQTRSPGWAHGVDIVAVLAMGNGDQLGAGNVLAILSGDAFKDGPHEIPMGGHGGENADLANEASPPTVLTNMGLRIRPGATYRIDFQSGGDTQDEYGCSFELVFQDEEVEQPKFWISSAITTTTVDVEAQGSDLTQTVSTIDPRSSSMIGSIIGCATGDMAALGVNHLVWKGTVGLEDPQGVILGGVGGELVIGSGAHNSPTQRQVSMLLKDSTSVMSEFMSIIEAGVMDGVIALGFVVA